MNSPIGMRQRSTAELITEWHRLSAAGGKPSPALIRVDAELARRALQTDDTEALEWMKGDPQ